MLSIILAIISYFISRKSGASKGVALGVAAATGAASWFTIDPQNSKSLYGDKVGKFLGIKGRSRAAGGGEIALSGSAGSATNWKDVGNSAIGGVADVLKSWGPAGVVGAGAGFSLLGWFREHPMLALGGIGGIIWMLSK